MLMTERNPISYKDAGVDIDAKMQAIDRLKARAQSTLGSSAGPIGHFGGTWRMQGPANQILVASADGVGTKLRLAFILGGDAHATIGADIVNHCVNDILALGATPLFFLDYFATGKLDPDTVEAVVGGIADACAASGVALLGGETAEMPDMYAEGEYDLAGFIVGSVTEDRIVDGSSIQPDDIVLGIPSTGLHTNGYSLARKVVGLNGDLAHDRDVLSGPLSDTGATMGEALVAGHRSYLPEVMPLLERKLIRGMAHITGGGLTDNLPRTLPEQCIAVLDPQSWRSLPIFDHLVNEAGLSLAERYRVFNMGVGFVLVVRPEDAMTVMQAVPDAVAIGRIIPRQTTDEAAVQGLFS
jgi:phosphoribosylformylglycinamidine cyclo-ligase